MFSLRSRFSRAETVLWLLGVTASVATAAYLSVATGNARSSDYALAEAEEIQRLAVAVAAAHDRDPAGLDVASTLARQSLVEMKAEAEAIIGPSGTEQGDALMGDLDHLVEVSRRAPGPETNVAIDDALLAYDRDLLTLTMMLTGAHMESMSALERTVSFGLVTIIVASVVSGGSVAAAARREALRRARQAERAAAELSDVLEATPDPIVVTDPQGRVQLTNSAFRTQFEWPQADGGTPGLATLAPEIPLPPAIGSDGPTAAHAPARTAELTARRTSGTTFPAEHSIVEARGLDGETQLVHVFHDLTARRAAEEERMALQEQLLISQRNEALSTLIAGVAHDFNNLLTAVRGSMEMARRKPEDQVRWLGNGFTAVDRAAALVRQLLQQARPGEGVREAVDMGALAGESVALARETFDRRVDLHFRAALDLPTVFGDRSQLQQVVMNLLVNARDAVEERLQSTDDTYRPSVTLEVSAAAPPAATIRLCVIDNGIGMTESGRARIFEPFFTTKGPGRGTGLGLSTSRSIVSQHGGIIEVQSAPGVGSQFVVTLPSSDAPLDESLSEPAGESDPPFTHPRLRGRAVLVVEDEPFILDFVASVLRAEGCEVTTATDGEQGLDAALREGVELVLLDTNLPLLSGARVRARLGHTRPDLTVLMMSGQPETDPGLEHVESVVLAKPFDAGTLLAVVEQALPPVRSAAV